MRRLAPLAIVAVLGGCFHGGSPAARRDAVRVSIATAIAGTALIVAGALSGGGTTSTADPATRDHVFPTVTLVGGILLTGGGLVGIVRR